METMWLVLIEVVAQTGTPPEPEIGFMNVTTWADSKVTASAKIGQYLESFGWHLVSVEKASVIDEDAECDEVLRDMIERTSTNQNAIILGTFHTYKTN